MQQYPGIFLWEKTDDYRTETLTEKVLLKIVGCVIIT